MTTDTIPIDRNAISWVQLDFIENDFQRNPYRIAQRKANVMLIHWNCWLSIFEIHMRQSFRVMHPCVLVISNAIRNNTILMYQITVDADNKSHSNFYNND